MKPNNNIYESVQGNHIFQIVEDSPEIGVYLYLYENGRCVADYLQSDIDHCRDFAFEEYDVPIDSWRLKDQ